MSNSQALPRISVAMGTYNGARYIAEQLASLAMQEVLPFELVVCDDGSSDGTPEMVEAFAVTAPFPVRVYRNKQNIGFAENFLKAASLCKGDWIAFCDQDDVWLPSKIELTTKAIQTNPGLTLILQNSFICDDALHHEGRIFPNSISTGIYSEGSQYGIWVWPGFLQTFRSDLIHLASLKPLPPILHASSVSFPHDRWTCLLANALGRIGVLGEPVALYRRHATALTGGHVGQTTTEQVETALAVNSGHYNYLARIAVQTGTYLRDLATAADEAVGAALVRSARSFDAIAAIQSRRAALYSATTLLTRLSCVAGIAAKGGYIGPAIIALGWRSGAKDMAYAFGLFGLIRKIIR